MSGEENKNTAITIAMIRMKPHMNAVGGPRRDWNHQSEAMPPAKLPTMPKIISSKPQCCRKNSAPGCFTSAAKTKYHCVMPLRNTPEVSPMAAISSINGLVKTFLSRSSVVSSMCIWPDEASCVSKYGKSASSGVSLMSHQSINTQTIKIADGMKNTAHVAFTDLVVEAKIAFSQIGRAHV